MRSQSLTKSFSRSFSVAYRQGAGVVKEMSRRRQAEEGEVMVGEAAQYEHGAQAAAEVAEEVRTAVKEMVAFNLLPATVWSLVWSGHGYPTIQNIENLRAEPAFWTLGDAKMEHLLSDTSVQTAVEAGDGHFPGVRVPRAAGRLLSAAQLTAIFNESIMPASLQHSTRSGYFSYWKLVVTWGVAHGEVANLLPMSQDTLKAITQELLMVGCATGTIRNVWSAIEDRSRRFGYPPPLGVEGDFSRMARAVGSVRGEPSRLIFPVGTHHVRIMLELVGMTLTQRRDMLITVVGTVACLRVCEVANLQLCDGLWNHDGAWSSDYNGTMALRVYKRKQDQVRKGLYPRIGQAVTSRLRAFVDDLGLEVSDDCTKDRSPGARCRGCPPLFPRAVAATARNAKPAPVSRQQVTKAVINSLKMLDVDTKHFSGLSMRRGGISAGLSARVPEPILFLQSGHGSNCAARNYMLPRDPGILFETYNAFDI